jgi:hypothetical protein
MSLTRKLSSIKNLKLKDTRAKLYEYVMKVRFIDLITSLISYLGYTGRQNYSTFVDSIIYSVWFNWYF